jgi:putative Mn2+ efflux pump MntP
MIKKADKYQKILIEFFNRLGVEETPPDFTENVMHRLGIETGVELVKTRPVMHYIITAILAVLMFLSVPFGSYIVNYANKLLYTISNFDYGFINRFFNSLIETIEGYSVTIAGLIILSASIVFFCVTLIINIQSYFYKAQRISFV